MKKHFFNYYGLTNDEISHLWDDGIFIFDTNVLMKFYCYTDDARTDFLNALKLKKDRIWVPNQVAFEYQKNRLGKIDEQMKAYDAIKELLDTNLHFNVLLSQLENYKFHPYIKKEAIQTQITEIQTKIEHIKKNLDETKKIHPNLINNDTIRAEITNLFDGRIGEPCTKAELEKIYKAGESRYNNNTPPGFKDSGKKDSTLIIGKGEERLIIDKYGDLIIWFEIIEKAKNDQKPVIFVTDDSKEDWWWEFKGEKFGPRAELIHEFRSKTGMLYHMYSADRFLEYLKENVGLEIKQQTIDEVRNVTLFDKKRQIDIAGLIGWDGPIPRSGGRDQMCYWRIEGQRPGQSLEQRHSELLQLAIVGKRLFIKIRGSDISGGVLSMPSIGKLMKKQLETLEVDKPWEVVFESGRWVRYDLDLAIANGDLVVEHGDLKLARRGAGVPINAQIRSIEDMAKWLEKQVEG